MNPPRPLGALRQWERELAAGYCGQRRDNPATWVLDDLYRAACYEAGGLDLVAQSCFVGAEQAFAGARRVLRDAMRRKRGAA